MISVGPWRPDVLVAGGGPSGICAAIAAARNGARTLLVERYGFLGGTATSASVGPFAPFHHGDEQVIKGIPQEIIERLVALGGSTGHLKIDRSYGSGTYMCWFDREVYKYAAFQLVKEAGAEILLHTWASEAVMEGDRLKGLIVQNKSGRQLIPADVIIDTTGDGDVIAASGARFEFGRAGDGRVQAMTMLFEMGGVDIPAVRRYIETHPEDFEWWSPVTPVRPLPPELQQEHFVAQGFLSLVKQAMDTGELYLGRNSVLLLTTLRPGMMTFNSTRVVGKKGTDARELSEAEIDGRRQVMSLAGFMKKHVPGFAQAYIVTTGVQIGVRETRRLVGEYVLTEKDVVRGNSFRTGSRADTSRLTFTARPGRRDTCREAPRGPSWKTRMTFPIAAVFRRRWKASWSLVVAFPSAMRRWVPLARRGVAWRLDKPWVLRQPSRCGTRRYHGM